MITPRFSITQDEVFVKIRLHVPYAKVSTFDFSIQDDTFKLFAKPYFIRSAFMIDRAAPRLVFPGRMVEDERTAASFDIDSGYLTVTVAKQMKGEHFADLDLLTLLKRKPAQQCSAALVEEVPAQTKRSVIAAVDCDEGNSDDEVDFEYQQELPVDDDTLRQLGIGHVTYGFGNRFVSYFPHLSEEQSEIIDLTDPDTTLAINRRAQRISKETADFDPDYYCADLVLEDEESQLPAVLVYNPWWSEFDDSSVVFTDEEKAVLQDLKYTDYLLEKADIKKTLIGLACVCFAYSYDNRTTLGDPTVESNWTIAKLCPVFSHLEEFSSLREAMIACFRRSLICFDDTVLLIGSGRRALLKALLNIRSVFLTNEFRQHLNNLFLDHYCVWIQSVRKKLLSSLHGELTKLSITKSDLSLSLEEVESWMNGQAQTLNERQGDEERRDGGESTEEGSDDDSTEDSDDESGDESEEESEEEEEEVSEATNYRRGVEEKATEIDGTCPVAEAHLDRPCRDQPSLQALNASLKQLTMGSRRLVAPVEEWDEDTSTLSQAEYQRDTQQDSSEGVAVDRSLLALDGRFGASSQRGSESRRLLVEEVQSGGEEDC